MARPKKYKVTLTEEERATLAGMLRKGKASARVLRRARTLLLAAGYPHKETAQVLGVSEPTVIKTCRRFVEEGLEAALYDRPQPGAQPKLDAKGEATLIALACTDPPEGMQLLADKLMESISDETVRRVLKPWQRPTSSGGWKTSWTCMRRPMTPAGRWCALMSGRCNCWAGCIRRGRRRRGSPGVRTAWDMSAAGRGWREVRVRERRTGEEFAWQMKWLVDEVIRVVLDNLNTHTPRAFRRRRRDG